MIHRKENNKIVKYEHLATGNYNGVTARIYSDFGLFTKDVRLTEEIDALTDILFVNLRRSGFKHLLVAPEFMKKQFLQMIEQEKANALAGKPAWIKAKMNSLVDTDIIKKLYDASNAGVKIQLIIRGICCLVPGVPNSSENIEIISIIDRFLEHARLYMFCNGGDEKIYLASADWMSRNLMSRIEVGFPVYAKDNQKIVSDIFDIQWNDQLKARKIDGINDIHYIHQNLDGDKQSSQQVTFDYLKRYS